jgi:hypothetical protein
VSQALHILRKDVRRLRWWLALWTALLAARVLLATSGTLVTSDGFAEQILMEQVKGALGIATFVLFGVLIARLVQEEPLVGLDWFWLTRPYDRWSLLGAKLTFPVLFFVVLPLVAELTVMAAYGAGTWDMLRASSVFVARDARWTAGLMLFAVLTPTLVGFALGIAATGAALSLALLGVFAVGMLRIGEETRPSPVLPDATQAVVATTLFILACLAVIVYQYHRRRRGRALALATVGLAAVVFVPSIWPWRITSVVPVAPAAVAQDTASVTVLVDRTSPPAIIDEPPFRRRDARRRQVSLPVELGGLPPGYRSQGTFAESRLELQSGEILESRQTVGSTFVALADFAGERAHELQGVLGDVRVLPVLSRDVIPPHVRLLSVTDEQLARYGSEPGRLTTTFHMPLQHSRVAGTLPLAEGALLRRGDMQIELVRFQQRLDGCTILLRQWRATSFLSPPEYRQHDFLLRNTQRQEAHAASPQRRSFGASGFFLSSLVGFSLVPGRQGFSVDHLWMDYPPRWGMKADRPTIDAHWLTGADLVVVETVPAGVISRTTVLDDFRMEGPPSAVSP